MAGFVAIFAHDASTQVSDGDLRSLAADYRALCGGGEENVLAAGDWGRVAWLGGEHDPAVERTGESWRLVVGRMHEQSDGYDGQFAAVAFDASNGLVEVITDPFLMQPVFVARRSERSYVSTSALALACHLRATPDEVGIKAFLRTGAQYGPITHWRGIERMSAATVATYRQGVSPRDRIYWRPQVDERVRGMSLSQTVDACVEAGLDVVGRRLGDTTELSADLTGGFDSRLVCSMLHRAGANFKTMTAGESRADARVAEEVARTAGWPWRAQFVPGDWTLSEEGLDRALGYGDAVLEVFNMAEVLWRQEERSVASRLTVTGGGGEQFGPKPWMQELWRAGRSDRVNFDNLMNMRLILPLDVSVFRADPRPEVESYVRDVLERAIAPYGSHPNTTQLDVVHAFREPSHFGAYRSAGERHVTAILPCYYRDLWTVAFSAHHRHRNGHRLHRGVIERLHPAVAAVETERGGPAALTRPRNAVRFVPYYARLGRTAVRKLRRRPRPPAEVRSAVRAAQRFHVRRLRDDGTLVPSSMRSGALYEPARLQTMIDSAAGGGECDWTLLGRIVTVELALRRAHASL